MRALRNVKPLGAAKATLSVALSASLAFMAVPATAFAAASDLAPAAIAGSGMQLLDDDDDEESIEYDISQSKTITVSGTEGNTYSGFPLDPITISDSANLDWEGKPETLTKYPEWNADYYVAYENNTNVGTAKYTIYGGEEIEAAIGDEDYFTWSDYSGTLSGTFEIAQADLSQAKAVALADGEKGIYLASSNPKPKMKIAFASHQEEDGWNPETYDTIYKEVFDYYQSDTDYTYVYRDSSGVEVSQITSAGTYTVEAVAASGNVTGTSEKVSFEVVDTAIDLSNATIEEIGDQEYVRGGVEPDLTVSIDGVTLEKDVDYKVEFSNNDSVGTATAKITGTGIYTGETSTTFTIVAADISGGADWNGNGYSAELDGQIGNYSTVPYTGQDHNYPVTVKYGSGYSWDSDGVTVELEYDKDYEVIYSNTKEVWLADDLYTADDHDEKYPEDKHPTVTVKGKGNYKGKIDVQFSITPPVDISTAIIRSIPSYTFDNTAHALTVDAAEIKYINLYAGTCDYGLEGGDGTYFTTQYKDASGNAIDAADIKNAGTYTMVLTGLESGGFFGTKEVNFSIAKANFADVEIADIPDQTLKIDGSNPTPVPALKYTVGTGRNVTTYNLVAGKDFDTTYSYPEEGTTVQVTVTPEGNFTGEARTTDFTISANPISAVVSAPVTWANASGVDWTDRMAAATTDGKVGIQRNGSGGFDVSLKPSNAMVAGFKLGGAEGADLEADDNGAYTVTVANLASPINLFVKVPMSPTKGYDGYMTLDLAKANFDLDEDVVYTAAAKWSQADGSDSMTAGFVESVNFAKTADGVRAIIVMTEEGAGYVTKVNDDSEAPYVIDVNPMGKTPVTFSLNVPGHADATAYLSFDIADAIASEMLNAAAAEMLIAAIAGLPAAAELTLDDKAAVSSARAAYDNLPGAYQALVTNYSTLTAAEAQVKALEAAKANKDAADAVMAKIKALPAKSKLALSDKSKVTAARTAYDKLTAAQKKLVTNYSTLTAAEAQVKALEAAKANKDAAAKAETAIVKAVKSGKAADVTSARKAYNKLTAAQKKLVSAKSLKNLAAVEADIAAKKVTSVTVNVATVNAGAVASALTKAGGSVKYVQTITLGSKVKKIAASAFAKCSKATTLVVKTKGLKASSVKNSLKGSKVGTVKVNVGNAKANKTYVKSYKKIFTKANAGKAASVK